MSHLKYTLIFSYCITLELNHSSPQARGFDEGEKFFESPEARVGQCLVC